MNPFHTAGTTALLLLLSIPVAQAATYRLTDLGTLGGSYSTAAAINDQGVITGASALAGDVGQNAFIYQNGLMTNLGVPETLGSGNAINNLNQIVGTHLVPGESSQPKGFLYDQGSITDLGTLGGGSYAYGINDAGQVVGASVADQGVGQAFIYQNGVMTRIPASQGGVGTSASAINATGAVAGIGSEQWPSAPFTYDNGLLTLLRDANGQVLTGAAEDINDANMVTGHARFAGSSKVSAMLYQNGVALDIGSLGGHWSSGMSLNERGEVVGSSIVANGRTYHAFVYSSDTGMVDLNQLIDEGTGWVLSSATSINERGQIVGSGLYNGVQRAYLLTPVPEPSTWALALFGVWLAWRHGTRRARGA